MTTENQKTNTNGEQKLTLKQIIERGKIALIAIASKWKWLIIAAMIGGALGAVYALSDVPTYTAPLKFMVNEDDGATSRGISSMLGSIGLGFGGSGTSVNLDKILEIATSNLITQKVLSDTIVVNGKEAITIDHLIENYGLAERITNRYPEIGGLSFAQMKEKDQLMANFVFKNIERQLIGTKSEPGIVTTTADDATGMMLIEAITISDELSLVIVESFYNALSEYYIARAIEPQKATLEKIQKKVDSLRSDILTKEVSLANIRDASKGLFMAKDRVREGRLASDVTVSSMAYGEAVKNLEMASFSMETSTPYFQVVDQPYLPIDASILDFKKSLIIGAFLGIFLGLAIVITIVIFRILLAE